MVSGPIFGRVALTDRKLIILSQFRLAVRRVAVAVLFSIALWSCEAESMGKLYLFSEVRGVVTQNGKPVAGAAVE